MAWRDVMSQKAEAAKIAAPSFVPGEDTLMRFVYSNIVPSSSSLLLFQIPCKIFLFYEKIFDSV